MIAAPCQWDTKHNQTCHNNDTNGSHPCVSIDSLARCFTTKSFCLSQVDERNLNFLIINRTLFLYGLPPSLTENGGGSTNFGQLRIFQDEKL